MELKFAFIVESLQSGQELATEHPAQGLYREEVIVRGVDPARALQSQAPAARESILWSRWAAAFYLQQRQKGCAHHTAVRALAYKWQRVIWRCWQDRRPYEEQIYEAALRQRGSPIVALFDRVELGKSPWKNSAKKNQKTACRITSEVSSLAGSSRQGLSPLKAG